jgi:3'(2'), 5'-bisphosphate nucleotidase
MYMYVTCMQGEKDPQTEADRKAQRCIVNTLAKRFPAMTVYGEEVSQP